MKREDCWMTFTEALEQYLEAREKQTKARNEYDRAWAERALNQAAEHLNALTSSKES